MVAHTYNSSTLEAEESKFETNLSYIMRLCLKNK